MNTKYLRRAIYGKDTTLPIERREYSEDGCCPVGCIEELREHFGRLGYTHLSLRDIDGVYTVDIATGEVKGKKKRKSTPKLKYVFNHKGAF